MREEYATETQRHRDFFWKTPVLLSAVLSEKKSSVSLCLCGILFSSL